MKTSTPIAHLKLKQSGLMRCCIQTITELADAHIEAEENEILQCKWCDESMRVTSRGTIEWNNHKGQV